MKNNLSKYYLQLAFFIVLIFGAIGNNYAHEIETLDLEISVEKGAVASESFKAWKLLDDAGAALAPLKTNLEFLKRLDANPKLINQLNSFDDAGKTHILANMDDYLKGIDVRPHILTGSSGVDDAVSVLGGVKVDPSPGGYIDNYALQGEIDAYQVIVANPNQVNTVALNLAKHVSGSANPPQSLINKMTDVVGDVRQHLFIDQHLVLKSEGQFVYGKFTPDINISNKWDKMLSPNYSVQDGDDLLYLLKHEYVESKLMKGGIVYRRSHGGLNSINHGAHDLAPLEHLNVGQFNHYSVQDGLNKSVIPNEITQDLSNLDEVLGIIKFSNGL